ncbi:MAG: ABC transporter permease [Chloroflexi bacterium]|nr:ABC transporter permease [Chloroflexota bacterium]
MADTDLLAYRGAQPEEIEEDRISPPTVGQLTWWRFRRSKPAIVAGVLLILAYIVAVFAGFFAPYHVVTTHSKFPAVGPNGIHFRDAEGNFRAPFVYGYSSKLDPATFQRVSITDTSVMYPVRFFAKGDEYVLVGSIKSDIHLFTVDDPGKVFLIGTDNLGRDLFSRIIYGARISLTVGLVGVFLSLIIGSVIGVAAGYYGGTFDNVAMRIVEVLNAFPNIPLWMALAAALPANMDSIKVYFGITIVLSFIGWGGLARQIRAKVLSLRESDFVMAAHVSNCSDWRIVRHHLLPNTLSHIIVSATLAIPGMILGETTLSFLGLGIKPPMTSWGLLLSEAQATRVLLQQPWLLWPIVPVMLTAIAYNLLGDGLRDAADPFAT